MCRFDAAPGGKCRADGQVVNNPLFHVDAFVENLANGPASSHGVVLR
jgi:hypothetical protein